MNKMNDLIQLGAAADRAREGYHHEEAVALYTQALELAEPAGSVDPRLEYDLRDGRAKSNIMLADMAAALADRQAMVDLAEEQLADPARLITALIGRSEVLHFQGDKERTLADLERALSLARKSEDRGLQIDALAELAVRNAEFLVTDLAREQAEEALRLSQELSDIARQAHAHRAKYTTLT